MTEPTVPEPTEIPVSELTRDTWIRVIDEEGDDRGEAVVLHVENFQGSATLLFRNIGQHGVPSSVFYDDATTTVPVLSGEQLAEMKAAAERARRIAGIRAFADFLEQNPWAPIENLHMQWSPNPNGDIWNSGTEGVAQVRQMAQQMGAEAVQSDGMTKATRRFGPVEYSLIAWHKGGRPGEPEAVKALVSDETLAELDAMAARDRAAGGPPWEVPAHPENSQPGGWHHGRLDPTGLGYSREQDDPTPVSPARGDGPVHTGGVVDGGELVDETPASGLTPAADQSRGPLAGTTPVVTYFSFGHGQTDPDTGQKLIDHYVTVVAPTYEECREAMCASRFGTRWSWEYLAGRAKTTEAVSQWTEHEVFVAPGTDPALAEAALKAASDLLAVEPRVHLEVAAAKTMCGLRVLSLPSGEPWTNDHDAVTCTPCTDGMRS